MQIAIVGKRRQSTDDLRRIALLAQTLGQMGISVSIEERLASLLRPHCPSPHWSVFTTDITAADFALSIGGDGTLLRTAQCVAEKEIPICGFNTGHLGFLAEENLTDAADTIRHLLQGRFTIESRTLLEVRIIGREFDDITPWPYALNEVAILRHNTANMISIDTRLDHIPLAQYQGDGLIVSTPTGSTAYNLSVDGPIVEPTAPVWVISPVAPHSLTMRPMVISDSRTVSLSVDSRSQCYQVSLDGRSVTLPADARLRISRAPFCTRIVHTPGHDFISTLRSKMLWGVNSR